MRIATFGFRSIPSNYSGVERAAEVMCLAAVRSGHSVVAYCMSEFFDERIEELYQGIRRVRVSCPKGTGVQMLVYSWLSAIRIALSRPDVVHVHALGPSVPVLLFKILRIPVVDLPRARL